MSELLRYTNPEPNFELMRTFAPGEREMIEKCLERARRKN